MKFAFLQSLLAKQTRRIIRTVNKQKDLKRIGIMLMLVPLVIPVGAAQATDVKPVNKPLVSNVITDAKFTFNDQITIQNDVLVTFDIKPSVKQLAVKKTQAEAVRVAVVSVSEPSAEEKRAWVQKAAATWNIDWRLLEAVWQVESGKTWQTARRSHAGATGPCQFMPGTWRGYAQDGDGNGTKSVTDARDCLFGSAKLLAVNGASSGDNRRALFAYNHSITYVNKVLGIAQSI